MRIVFFILISIHSIILTAQVDYTFNSLYRTFEEGQSFYILKDGSTIHAAPFVTATKLASLRSGTPIRVEERMDELFKINGFRTNWYRIIFDNNGLWAEGYIWGGDIAVGAFYAKENPDVLFLYGIDEIRLVNRGDYTEESLQLCLYACRNGRVQDVLRFEAMGTLYTKTQGRAYGNRGVEMIQDVLEIAFSDGYCGGVAATVTVFWDGQQLHYINLLSNGFSSETFSNRFYIYPAEHKKQGQIIILKEEAGSFELNKKVVYTHQLEKQFIWEGKRLKALD
ncbi:hypothetical protein [Aureispira anguillae]|uniref:SH3 domain-containing protein n=1 Tax=Aureispira anguillae TaxID=2864201 RepID=A0A916DXS5_9BACT|nr:hypothetical protein [Aureispira anguillae]BDS15356.1 hypothetical protein AsAng_0061400 [Aureispira anguillae]